MSRKNKGKFITLEGCEGVGKSSQCRLLKEYCEKNGIDAVFTREPGGTPVAERIREVILSPASAAMEDVTELLLYAAARRQHTRELIMPALNAGKTVFCDRYIDSTTAYQGYARGLSADLIRKLNRIATDGVKIDMTLFLDADPLEGFRRKGGRDQGDRLETEDFDFHERVYEGFKLIAQLEKKRVVTVKTGSTKYETHEMIINILKEKGIF